MFKNILIHKLACNHMLYTFLKLTTNLYKVKESKKATLQ